MQMERQRSQQLLGESFEDQDDLEATLAELADLVLAERERRTEAESVASTLRERIDEERRQAGCATMKKKKKKEKRRRRKEKEKKKKRRKERKKENQERKINSRRKTDTRKQTTLYGVKFLFYCLSVLLCFLSLSLSHFFLFQRRKFASK